MFLAGCAGGAYVVGQFASDGVTALKQVIAAPFIVVALLLTVGAVRGVTSARRQIAATRRLRRQVARHRVAPPHGIPAGVAVVEADGVFAFTLGLRRPRIVLSQALVDHLTPAELAAVVAHEGYHVRARDPLRIVAARVAASAAFFLPAVRHLVRRYVVSRELAADRQALRESSAPALAGALLKTVSARNWDDMAGAAAIAGAHLEIRVDQLECRAEPPLPSLPLSAVVASAVVVLAMASVVITAGFTGLRRDAPVLSAPGADAGYAELLVSLGLGAACAAGWLVLAMLAFRRLSRRH